MEGEIMSYSRIACLIALGVILCAALAADAGTRSPGFQSDGFVTPGAPGLSPPVREGISDIELPPEVVCVVLPDEECLFAELRFDGMFVYGYWDPDCQGNPVVPMLGSRGRGQTSIGTEIEGQQCLVVFESKFEVGDGLLPSSVLSAYCSNGEVVEEVIDDVAFVPVPAACSDID
jgi:hypothetical protein